MEDSRHPRDRLLGVLPWQTVENLWDGGLEVPVSRVVTTVNVERPSMSGVFEPFVRGKHILGLFGLETVVPKQLRRVKVANR